MFTIRLMGRFELLDDGLDITRSVSRYGKGLGIMQYLILNHDTPVSIEKLKSLFWDDGSGNADAALKTTVFRFRELLKEVDPALSACLASRHQAYIWTTSPKTDIDLLRIENLLFDYEKGSLDAENDSRIFKELSDLYRGPMLSDSPYRQLFSDEIRALHIRYQKIMRDRIRILKAMDHYAEVIDLARKAVRLFPEDELFYRELIWSIDRIGGTHEAVEHYKYSAQLQHNYMHVDQDSELQGVYDLRMSNDEYLDRRMSEITSELIQDESRGAFFCDYIVFQEIYDLLSLELKRTKSSIWLGVVAIQQRESDAGYEDLASHIEAVKDLIRYNLRKGDVFCLSSPNIFALLLPTTNQITGNMVMDRLSRVYYTHFPDRAGTFNYRVYPLLEAEE